MQAKIEVELRAKISPELTDKLKRGSKVIKSVEHDTYFSYVSDSNKSWIVRIRITGKKAWLTFKSNNQFGEGAWNEVDFPIPLTQSKQLSEFFLSNGFYIDVEIKKKRYHRKIAGMSINIDEIDKLGLYVEAELLAPESQIEAAKNKIYSFLKDLGIQDSQITSEGYVSLMRKA
ncbi:class IV adenylate cyclase [Candidatus Daviesbacteria bacterium]|nr:class IV adenylate cyclase [Candidatus Daviesbacteria bacterium]